MTDLSSSRNKFCCRGPGPTVRSDPPKVDAYTIYTWIRIWGQQMAARSTCEREEHVNGVQRLTRSVSGRGMSPDLQRMLVLALQDLVRGSLSPSFDLSNRLTLSRRPVS